MPTYSLQKIKGMWNAYQTSQGWHVLRDGKWTVYTMKPDTTGMATRVEMVKLKTVMSFPEFIEKFYNV